ncbi:N-acetylmuramoyl-L-alanine amidase [Paenibacillus azoreducens]|uniref:N-acetylmuramoyl-L-alanine amidase CwlD n=1 Tax=Paenibacillus azoreducens TaxID=116718 RepID=A0A920CSD6_9BACL|nr:N-acetylmuramoyl-L-alanine amidase [Paenibacillus azoreducens]GIO49180.1 N-acetylmuramoyl-L-alanine amidase CwlD [Paenibacillus azoreducens]
MNKFSKLLFSSLITASLTIASPLQVMSLAAPEEVKEHPAFPRDVIIIDAGHGGVDGGTSFQNILEKDITLAISQKVFMLLRSKGYHAILNRTGDYALSDDNHWLKSRSRHQKDLAQRKELSQQIPTLVVVSLHVNWSRNTANRGGLVLFQKEGRSVMLALAIQEQLDQLYGLKGSIKHGRPFYLLNQVADPAVIVETGFLSNAEDRAMLTDRRGQLKIAKAIVNGINYYLTAI